MSWTKAYIKEYKITVREPNWEDSTMLWESFSTSKEAEEFLREVAPTYPEGTVLFITAIWGGKARWASSGMTVYKSYIVNEYGEPVKRARKWIPNKRIPIEWVKKAPELEEPKEPDIVEVENPYELVEGYNREEEAFEPEYDWGLKNIVESFLPAEVSLYKGNLARRRSYQEEKGKLEEFKKRFKKRGERLEEARRKRKEEGKEARRRVRANEFEDYDSVARAVEDIKRYGRGKEG